MAATLHARDAAAPRSVAGSVASILGRCENYGGKITQSCLEAIRSPKLADLLCCLAY